MLEHVVIARTRMLANGCSCEAEQHASGASHDSPCALHKDMAGTEVFLGSLPWRMEALLLETKTLCLRVLRRWVTSGPTRASLL